ncbi:Uncharacterized conserved protein YcbK, DUF882 family [Epibacterium ulvae]|uniref:Uncharacterized conserved protein YcbK, DUF882 family n=1 Tax=Epibacterium ulvae TaxID=1156985 RepID=A0A1G5REZ9_9RHOB|nr:D-Ala-D-Ala carboxypeptidase family metallohydrolase [Epibacterium ulvae]SCZ72664.1 Uncharacterized conserved protein YcbK, DUF882 family [Epibacterium ulvae]
MTLITRRHLLAGAASFAATSAHASNGASIGFYTGYPDQITGWTARHFKPEEFASNGNGLVKISARLVAELDQVRAELGQPIVITSGYRDPAWNKAVGGATHSRHLISDAVDISLQSYSVAECTRLASLLMAHGFTSFGTYRHIPHMLHADMRPKAASWHSGGGTGPMWLSRAMRKHGWTPGIGPTR